MFTISYTTKMKSNLTTDVLTIEAQHYEEVCKATRSCYEKIDDKVAVRMYADFDYKPENVPDLDAFVYDENKTDELIALAKETLTKVFASEFDLPEPPRFAVKKQSSPLFFKDGKESWKYSFHMIICNYKMQKPQQLQFFKQFNRMAKASNNANILDADDKFTFFDESVYKPNQKLRSPYCSKHGENRPSVIVEGTFMDTIISYKDDSIRELEWKAPALSTPVNTKVSVQTAQSVADEETTHQANEKLFSEVERLYMCFSPERCAEHTSWVKLGQATKEVLGEAGKELFVFFTSQFGTENKKLECSEKYDYFKIKNSLKSLTIKSLYYWAKQDNLVLFEELFPYNEESFMRDIREMRCTKGEADFAKAFKAIVFQEKQVLFTGEDKHLEGYIFNGIYWQLMPQHDADLHQNNFDLLTDHFKEILERMQPFVLKEMKYAKLRGDVENEQQWKELKKEVSGIAHTILGLQSYAKRSAIVKIFKRDNYQPKVEWNKNKNLFVFEDCVYDLLAGRFRNSSCASEYIRTSCGYKYNIDSSVEEIESAKRGVMNFFASIVHEPTLEYLMTTLSTFLKQTNKEEKAYFWLGDGRNGKGTATTMLRQSLGSYWGELGIDYYTNHEKGVDRPNQNLYDCKDARVLNTSEVQDNAKTGMGVNFIGDKFKLITGGDPISVRELGTKSRVTYNPGHILVQTNTMPSFTKMDSAIENRVIVIEFPFEFTDDKSKLESKPLCKQKDESLKERLTSQLYRRALIDILFDYYKKYILSGISVPDSVKIFTKKYFASQSLLSILNLFCLEEQNSSIPLEELKQMFKDENDLAISVQKLRSELKNLGLTVTKRNLIHWREKEKSEDGEEDHAT